MEIRQRACWVGGEETSDRFDGRGIACPGFGRRGGRRSAGPLLFLLGIIIVVILLLILIIIVVASSFALFVVNWSPHSFLLRGN